MTPLDNPPTTDSAGKTSDISAVRTPGCNMFIARRLFPIVISLPIMDSLGY